MQANSKATVDLIAEAFDGDLVEVLSDETSFNFSKSLISYVTSDPIKFGAALVGEMLPDVNQIPWLPGRGSTGTLS